VDAVLAEELSQTGDESDARAGVAEGFQHTVVLGVREEEQAVEAQRALFSLAHALGRSVDDHERVIIHYASCGGVAVAHIGANEVGGHRAASEIERRRVGSG
jgi:hypothetical protein